jgi:hypothetical protein
MTLFAGADTPGTWGAFLRAAAPYSASGAPLEPCGTPAALQRHYRHGEDPCPWCKPAVTRVSGPVSRGGVRPGVTGHDTPADLGTPHRVTSPGPRGVTTAALPNKRPRK